MRNSLGSSQGDLRLKGQSCFWFPLSALAEHEGNEGNLWVRSGRSHRGQSTGAPGIRRRDADGRRCGETQESGILTLSLQPGWGGEGVPADPSAVGMVGHSGLGDTTAQSGFGHCSDGAVPRGGQSALWTCSCPSQHCWVWFGSSIVTDEDPCWIWGLLWGSAGTRRRLGTAPP